MVVVSLLPQFQETCRSKSETAETNDALSPPPHTHSKLRHALHTHRSHKTSRHTPTHPHPPALRDSATIFSRRSLTCLTIVARSKCPRSYMAEQMNENA